MRIVLLQHCIKEQSLKEIIKSLGGTGKIVPHILKELT